MDSIKTQAEEGCNFSGFIEVNKVSGNFHFAPGKAVQAMNMHVHGKICTIIF